MVAVRYQEPSQSASWSPLAVFRVTQRENRYYFLAFDLNSETGERML